MTAALRSLPAAAKAAVWVGFAVLSPPAVAAQSTTDPELRARVDAVFGEYDRTDSPGCALGVVQDGALVYARGYGMANLDLGVAITPSTVFRIGSTSKQFTAAAVVLAELDGILSLDDDIREYLPEMPDYGQTITVRQLLHHTSGVRDYLGLMSLVGLRDDDWYTVEEALEMIARQRETNFEPGTEHLYSNSGYFLLSQIIERASGESLREYADRRIFGPLGMRDTHFHDDHTEVVPGRAVGYAPGPDDEFRISVTTLDMVGDGGVFTSVEDLARWDRNFLEPEVGGATLIDELLTRGILANGDTLDYALGLSHDEHRGHRVVRHGGAFVGYRAEMMRFPDQGLSVICLCNLSSTSPSRLAEAVADIYLPSRRPEAITEGAAGGETAAGEEAAQDDEADADEEAATSPEYEVSLPTDVIAAWAGLYRNLETGSFVRLEARDDGLYIQVGPGFRLVPVARDRFLFREADAELRFGADLPEDAALVIAQGGSTRTYEKVEPADYAPEELTEFTGTYHSDELDADYLVFVAEGRLLVRRGRGDPIPLRPTVPDEFTLEGADVRFERDATGRPVAFVLDAGRVRGLHFERLD